MLWCTGLVTHYQDPSIPQNYQHQSINYEAFKVNRKKTIFITRTYQYYANNASRKHATIYKLGFFTMRSDWPFAHLHWFILSQLSQTHKLQPKTVSLHTVILPIGKVGSYRIFYSDISRENNFKSLKVIKIRDQKKPCLP